MTRRELNQIGKKLGINCKGTGKPGPCKGSGSSTVAKKANAPRPVDDFVSVHGKTYELGGPISYKGEKGKLIALDPNGKQLMIRVGETVHSVSGKKLLLVSK